MAPCTVLHIAWYHCMFQGTIACFNVPNDIFQGALVHEAEDLGAEHRGWHLILYMSMYHCISKCLNVNDAVSCLNYQGIFQNVPGYTCIPINHN